MGKRTEQLLAHVQSDCHNRPFLITILIVIVIEKAKRVQQIIFNIHMASNRVTDLLLLSQLNYVKCLTHNLK